MFSIIQAIRIFVTKATNLVDAFEYIMVTHLDYINRPILVFTITLPRTANIISINTCLLWLIFLADDGCVQVVWAYSHMLALVTTQA